MALQKSFEDRNGNNYQYWRITPNISVDFAAKTARASLVGYVSAATRTAGKKAMPYQELLPRESHQAAHNALTLSGADFTAALTTGDLRAALYTKLKALTVFDGAVDV
jgi:hypothetical protein